MSITLRLEGFDEMLKEIEAAGGTIDSAAKQCITESANIMHNELITQMKAANVDSGLVDRMPAPDVETSHNSFIARVGYKKGAYDPNNPSDGYKVVFANYENLIAHVVCVAATRVWCNLLILTYSESYLIRSVVQEVGALISVPQTFAESCRDVDCIVTVVLWNRLPTYVVCCKFREQ